MNFTIIRIKPNPIGKDRSRTGSPPPTQLAAEWVDFRNDGASVSLSGVGLYHKAYGALQWRWARIMTFSDILGAAEVVRVHAGKQRAAVISPEDLVGAHYHLFTGDDEYVWNNTEGDQPLLNYDPTNETIDTATYDPHPPEGVILVRQGSRLVAHADAVGW